MGECEPRNFLQPCLLLLLFRERADHGYDLANQLRDMHVAEGDPGTVYRALRGLERQGLVRSTWQTSDAAATPTYRLTAERAGESGSAGGAAGGDSPDTAPVRTRYEQLMEMNGNGNGHSPTNGHSAANGSGQPDDGVIRRRGDPTRALYR